MTDFDYEVRDRSSLARQSRYRKCGSRTRYVALPSDGMTQKQWKEKNGKVVSYSMNKPMDWKQFRMISGEMQTDYIKRLQDDYSANAHMLSEMFGVSPFTILEYCKKHKLGVTFPRGGRVSDTKVEAFKRFLSQCDDDSNHTDQDDQDAASDDTEGVSGDVDVPRQVGTSTKHIDGFTVSFRGDDSSLPEIYNMLRCMVPPGQEFRMTIRYEVTGDDCLPF